MIICLSVRDIKIVLLIVIEYLVFARRELQQAIPTDMYKIPPTL